MLTNTWLFHSPNQPEVEFGDKMQKAAADSANTRNDVRDTKKGK
jgi:hypothetical protein